MKEVRRFYRILLLIFAGALPQGCEPAADGGSNLGAGGREESAEPGNSTGEPVVHVHYLGHASFLLTFGPGSQDPITVLTDYGESRAYGLDSPVYPLGEVVPDIVTLSHDHADHAGGILPEGSYPVLKGEGMFERGDLTITPIPTYEGNTDEADNSSFLFTYKGIKILHLGDCQGLITGLGEDGAEKEETVRLVRALYPDQYDLVFLPIGFTRNILEEAAEFMTFLTVRNLVPMHFWRPEDRGAFMALIRGTTDKRLRQYWVQDSAESSLDLFREEGPRSTVTVVGLIPASPP